VGVSQNQVVVKKPIEEDDDWDIGFSGGGVYLSRDNPTQEQLDAEKAAHAVLFAKERAAQEDAKRRADAVYARLAKLKETMTPVKKSGIWEEYKPEDQQQINALQKEASEIDFQYRLNNVLLSPMFTNEDGFTAMNDDGICTTYEDCFVENRQENHAEQLDALFPPPLQEFSF
jgi:hypothetical protein